MRCSIFLWISKHWLDKVHPSRGQTYDPASGIPELPAGNRLTARRGKNKPPGQTNEDLSRADFL